MKKTLKNLRKMRALARELSELRGHHRHGAYRRHGYSGSYWDGEHRGYGYRDHAYRDPYWRGPYRRHHYSRGRLGLKELVAAYIARMLFSR